MHFISFWFFRPNILGVSISYHQHVAADDVSFSCPLHILLITPPPDRIQLLRGFVMHSAFTGI